MIGIRFYIEEKDKRMIYLSDVLKDRGYELLKYGEQLYEPVLFVASPGTRPDVLNSYIDQLPDSSIVIGGQRADLIHIRRGSGIRYINITDDEVFAVNNAIPTAEGAIALVMANSDKVIQGMNITITGYGRITKALAPRLRALGARVHIVARNPVDRAWACDYYTYSLDLLANAMLRSEVIINTVPTQIIKNEILDLMPKKTLLIELASTPYGFDSQYATKAGLVVVPGPALPAKAAPYSAAVYMADAIYRLTDIQPGVVLNAAQIKINAAQK